MERFGDFFDTPVQNSAAPQALGFNGFFRGAYSYHFHNFWLVLRLHLGCNLLTTAAGGSLLIHLEIGQISDPDS